MRLWHKVVRSTMASALCTHCPPPAGAGVGPTPKRGTCKGVPKAPAPRGATPWGVATFVSSRFRQGWFGHRRSLDSSHWLS